MKQWIVTGTSMVVEAEDQFAAVDRAQESSGWHWEARQVSGIEARPTTSCGCGYDLIWVNGEWQHDAAPDLWGDDHDPHPDEEPDPEAVAYWDEQDGVST